MLANLHQPVYQVKRVRHAGSTDHQQHQMVRLQNKHGSLNTHKTPTDTMQYCPVSLPMVWPPTRSSCNHPLCAIYSFNPRAEGWSRSCGAPRTGWAMSLPKTSNTWGQHWQRLPTSPSTVLTGGQPLFFVPSPRPRGKSLSE